MRIDTLRLRKFRMETIIATAEAKDPPVMPELYADAKPAPASQILKNQVLGSKIAGGASQMSLGDAKEKDTNAKKQSSRFSLFTSSGDKNKKEPSAADLSRFFFSILKYMGVNS